MLKSDFKMFTLHNMVAAQHRNFKRPPFYIGGEPFDVGFAELCFSKSDLQFYVASNSMFVG